jgi:GNAT superfamily N-acetyltransferase
MSMEPCDAPDDAAAVGSSPSQEIPSPQGIVFTEREHRPAFLVSTLEAPNASAYGDLTMPGCLPLLARIAHDRSVVALGGTRFGRPIGLILAELSDDGADGVVLSLFVRPGYRGIGVGTALLAALEVLLTDRGCQRLSMTYDATDPTSAALEAMLRRCGWEQPEAGVTSAQDTRVAAKRVQAPPTGPSSCTA